MTVIEEKIEKIKKDWDSYDCPNMEDFIAQDNDLEPFRESLLAFEKNKIEEWAKKYEEDRLRSASALAKNIYSLNIGESHRNYTRVPGGWVFESLHESGNEYDGFRSQILTVFIPFNNEFNPDLTKTVDGKRVVRL